MCSLFLRECDLKLTDEEMRLALLVDNLNIHFSIETETERLYLHSVAYLASKLGYSVSDEF